MRRGCDERGSQKRLCSVHASVPRTPHTGTAPNALCASGVRTVQRFFSGPESEEPESTDGMTCVGSRLGAWVRRVVS